MREGNQQPKGGWSTRATAVFILAAVFVLGPSCVVFAAEQGDVVINEVMWDGKEYIEFYNISDEEVDVSGWTLWKQKSEGVDEGLVYEFRTGTVVGVGDEGYFLLESTEAATDAVGDGLVSLHLVNDGLLLILKSADGEVVDRANWYGVWLAGENTTEGISMERAEDVVDGMAQDSWYSSTGYVAGRNGTPGVKNSEPKINHPPEAVISGPTEALVGEEVTFSGEDSGDPDGDDLVFAWTISNGDTANDKVVISTFDEPGAYTVELEVSDGELLDEAPVHNIKVKKKTYLKTIVINEVVPNIDGDDKLGEFVELKNMGSEQIDLSGWRLLYGSRSYTIKAATVVAGGYIVFDYATTKRYLTNAGATMKLIDPNGDAVSTVTYPGGMAEDYSYSRQSNGEYEISTKVTKGKANEFVSPQEADEEEEENKEDEESDPDTVNGEVAGTTAQAVLLAKVREMEEGQIVTVEGVVSVPPGVFGERIIYLAGSGIQIYYYAADWPELALGDVVRITGEYVVSSDEARIKVEEVGDIERMSSADAPEAHQLKTGEIGEEQEGWLVTIQGEVSSTSGDTFYVDDGSGEIKVYIKESTAIDKPKMKKGEAVTVTGVVSQTRSGYRVLPRFQEDVRLGRVAGMTSFPATGYVDSGAGQQERLSGQWRSDMLLFLWLVVVFVLVMARRAREPLFI